MSEQIQISEVDETGAALEAAELEHDFAGVGRINPWLIALWVLCAVSVGLFVLAVIGTEYRYPSSYSTNFPNEPAIDRPWYTALAPFSWIFLMTAFLSILCTLVLQAAFWQRRRG